MLAGWIVFFLWIATSIFFIWRDVLQRREIERLTKIVRNWTPNPEVVEPDHTGFMAYDDGQDNVLGEEDDNFEGRAS